MSPLVDADEAAEAVGLSKFSLYRLAQTGRCPFYRSGRAIRFDVSELRAWMRGQAETHKDTEDAVTA